MKNFIKSSLILLLIIVNSCSKDESAAELPKETISLEDGLDISFEDLTVITVDGEFKLDEDGKFEANTNSNLIDKLPLLIMKGEEAWFGYYPKTVENNVISIEDILFFYFSTIPDISMLGLSDSELLIRIKDNSNYEELKNHIKTSLNSNQSPMKNEVFIGLLVSSSEVILNKPEAKVSNSKGDFIGEFKFSHTRDGKISWPEQVPLFANIGFEIRNKSDNSVVFGPHIIESKSISISPVAGVYWIYNELFGEAINNNTVTSFQLQPGMEGDYSIYFTNGRNGNDNPLAETVHVENRSQWIALVLQQVVPLGGKVLKKMQIDCGEQFGGLMASIGEKAYEQVLLNKNPSAEDMYKVLDDVGIDVMKMSTECVGSVSWGTWFERMLKYVDVFNRAGKITELMFATRDWIGSDITGEEFRYYYGNKSFGYLKSENISPRDFVGTEGSEHVYESSIQEKIIKYEVRREELVSSFTLQEEFVDADGLPFEFNRTSGDATLMEGSPVESFQGLFVHFKMGKEDSEFEIKPEFVNNSDRFGYSTDFVTLKISMDSIPIYKAAAIGNWTTTWHMDTNGDGLLNDDDQTQIDHVVFYEDGIGKRLSSIDYSGNFTDYKDKWGSDPFYDIRWSITKGQNGYFLSYSDLRWGVSNGGKINSYPNMTCTVYKFGNTEHTITVKD